MFAIIKSGAIVAITENSDEAERIGGTPIQIPADLHVVARNGYRLIVSGGEIVEDLDAARSRNLAALRSERNARLAACDWTQTADAPLAQAARDAWRSYRQALRDLPSSAADAANPVWPEPPLG